MKKSLIALFATAALAQSLAAQSLIVPGGSQVGGWGVGGIQTVGQTFTALNSRLNGFSFWLKNEVGPPVTFIAYVFQWDDVTFRATGPALYVSAMSVSPPPPALPGFTPYSFLTSTALTTGGRYVAFMSVVGFNGLFASVESSATDVYSGGTFVFTSRPPMLFAWDTYSGIGNSPPPRDLRFEASFSPVPEPASILLMAVGLAGIHVATRRRRVARRAPSPG